MQRAQYLRATSMVLAGFGIASGSRLAVLLGALSVLAVVVGPLIWPDEAS